MFSSNKKLGIVGGGQLGKMLLYTTRQWDIYTKVLDADCEAPSRLACNEFVQGSLTDFETVYNFGKDCDVITIEIENVNTDALQKLEDEGKIIHPKPSAIKLIKDKGLQKEFYKQNHLPTSAFQLFDTIEEVKNAIENKTLLFPFVQKSRTEGYDGKGVAIIKSDKDLDKLLPSPSVIESLVDIASELAVIAVRNSSGELKSYDTVSMEFHPEANLLDLLLYPAPIENYYVEKTKQIAEALIEKLDMCGLLAVEFFLTKQGEILINEIAPRPHNSGHQTIESCFCSQYENHLRAVFNFPLGSTHFHTPSAMINILGDKDYAGAVHYKNIENCMSHSDIHLHIYGKKITKPYRKMGHATITNKELNKAKEKALWLRNQLQVISL